MLIPDQPQFVRPDLSGPYAKLARHITAMYEIVRLAPTNDPSRPGSPSTGLSARDREGITAHLRECMEMIATLEKWMMNPVMVIDPEPPWRNPDADWFRAVPDARPDQPEDYLDPEHVRKQREIHDRLRAKSGDDDKEDPNCVPPEERPVRTPYERDADLCEWIQRYGRHPSKHELLLLANRYGDDPAKSPYWLSRPHWLSQLFGR